MSALTVTGVTKSFGDTVAVDDVTLHVPHGSLTAVLGPSGCGKTTLLRLVAGFLDPDAGTIAFDDRVVAGEGRPATPQQRRVGYVPQEGALFPHLDVAANIAFGLPRAERRSPGAGSDRVDEMLDLVELPRTFRSRQPHELSGGQQQRVALARALAPRPSVVLLDEPFSSLDASLRETTGRAVARALRAAHATGLLVTHDQAEALSLSDQVAVLRAGRLIQAGSPADVYLAPHDPELARFVGGATSLAGRCDRAGADPDRRHADSDLGRVSLTHPAPADELVLVVRPDQVRFGESGVAARVDEVSFYGHDAAVRLTLTASGTPLVARVTGPTAPAAGDDVLVSVYGPVHAYPAPDCD
ncbi:ABC transporter ATP-binding protein [Nocardioides gansuensis]|uniref:ABC-type quaternary amine transporter n=1 Tax=Nocardioides gansuensis TaxID=2138300 RepID=A0A2T8F4R7_9ACTN|nr:ABC transporter ATP-binding protein [Nocardioides gansuensis]PVG80670.1 ABC transporter ATP-binding protein [Nocardioides gansuensis]